MANFYPAMNNETFQTHRFVFVQLIAGNVESAEQAAEDSYGALEQVHVLVLVHVHFAGHPIASFQVSC